MEPAVVTHRGSDDDASPGGYDWRSDWPADLDHQRRRWPGHRARRSWLHRSSALRRLTPTNGAASATFDVVKSNRTSRELDTAGRCRESRGADTIFGGTQPCPSRSSLDRVV